MNQQTRRRETQCGGRACWAGLRLPVAVVELGGQQGGRPRVPQVQRAQGGQGLSALQRRGPCARRGPHPGPAVLSLLVRAVAAPTLAGQQCSAPRTGSELRLGARPGLF